MGEVPFSNLEYSPETLPSEGMVHELSMQRKKWEKTGEPVMAAQCEGLVYAAMIDPVVASIINSTYEVRKRNNPDISFSEVVGILRTTLIMDQLEQGNNPVDYTHRSQWIDPIREVAHLVAASDTPPELLPRFERRTMNLMGDFVCTTPYGRATGEELLMQGIAPYRPDGFRVLDIGSGMLQSILQVLAKHTYGFDPVTLYSAPPIPSNFSTWEPQPDLSSKANNDLLLRPHKVTEAVATDIIDPYKSVHNKQWSKASLRVSREQNNARFMAKYNGLAAEHPAELSFYPVDFTSDVDVERFKSSIGDTKFDMVIMSAVQHQQNPKQRQVMDKHAISLAAEDGFIVKQDFFSVTPSRPRQLKFYKHWHLPGRFRLAVFQPDYPKRGWQEMFAARDSRMTELYTSWGSIAINGSFLTADELLRTA